jgi:broad specificity phosphatase PhoE
VQTKLRIIFVRHGESLHNKNNVLQGRLDTPLSEAGIAQARAVARRLSKEKINAIYSSPLKRARSTAEEIARRHPGLKLRISPEIVEQDFGTLEGSTMQVWYNYVVPGGKPHMHRKFPRGEGWYDVRRRVIPFLDTLLKTGSGKTFVIVAHGSVTRQMISYLLEIPVPQGRPFFLDNAAIAEVVIGADYSTLEIFNDKTHLRRKALK